MIFTPMLWYPAEYVFTIGRHGLLNTLNICNTSCETLQNHLESQMGTQRMAGKSANLGGPKETTRKPRTMKHERALEVEDEDTIMTMMITMTTWKAIKVEEAVVIACRRKGMIGAQ
jgi:hypothetical protein